MRSTDRPEAAALRADAPPAGERRTLAARLLRLPDGHPSSLRADGAEGDWQPDAADEEQRPADLPAETEDAAGQEDSDYADDPDDPGQPGSDPPAGPEPGSRAAGRPSAGGAMGGHEPYRPWFTDGGGGGDPWFVADP